MAGTPVPSLQGDDFTVALALLDRYEAEWTDWRYGRGASWVAEAKAILKRVQPNDILGLFDAPWRLVYGSTTERRV